MTQSVIPDPGRPLRIGVVGVGIMGSNHARVFAGLPDTQLVAVADPDVKQAEFVARTLCCAAVTDIGALLDLKLDAVTIAAPTHLHRDSAMEMGGGGDGDGVELEVEQGVDISDCRATEGAGDEFSL